METELRQRVKSPPISGIALGEEEPKGHPGGDIKHGAAAQILRLLLFIIYFNACCCSIVATQFFGVPLYWLNRDLYYAYIALTKQSFGVVVTTLTQWWAPTPVRVSGDASVAGQIKKTKDGRVELDFPERVVLIGNHQIYSDWLYFWWAAYTNTPPMHGHIYIILKESLKWVPVIGWGMMFYGFIFMSRKMATDQPRLAHRLQKLKTVHAGPMSGTSGLDPMWLLLFPEGTNLSANTRKKSAAWAEKQGIKDFQHVLLPRSTGTFFCLNELKGTVDYVYDCTVAYGGIPRGEYGQDLFSLRSMYFQGRPPPSVNMHWRRLAIADMPLDDPEKFELWLRERWHEKDLLLEHFVEHGSFPSDKAAINGAVNEGGAKDDVVETEVKLGHWYEVFNIFIMLATFALIANMLARIWSKSLWGRSSLF